MKQKFFWALTALIACNAGLEARAAQIVVDIDLQMNTRQPVEVVNKQISNVGKVFCTYPDKRQLTIRLNDAVSLSDAVQRLLTLNSLDKIFVHPPELTNARRTKPTDFQLKQFKLLQREFSYLTNSNRLSKIDPVRRPVNKEAQTAAKSLRKGPVGKPNSGGKVQTMGFQYPGWGLLLPKWSNIGPFNAQRDSVCWTGRVDAVAIHPTSPSTMYIGGDHGGLWKTTDSGSNWSPLSDDWDGLMITSIAIDPTNQPETVLVAITSTGQDLRRSTDGGSTWTAVGGTQLGNTEVNSIYMVPDDPSIVLVAAANGLYRSTTGGVACTKIDTDSNGNSMSGTFYNIAGGIKEVGFARNIYVTAYVNSTKKMYRSTDNGQSWTAVTFPSTQSISSFRIAGSLVSRQTIYAYSGHEKKVWKSTDAGSTWPSVLFAASANSTPYNNDTTPGHMFSQPEHNSMIGVTKRVISGAGVDVLYVGGVNLMYTTDGGSNWTGLGGIGHADYQCFAPHPQSANFIFGSDGGVFAGNDSYDGDGDGFPPIDVLLVSDLNAELCLTEFYAAAFSATNDNIRIGGAQDNFSPANISQNSWIIGPGGDGVNCAINPANNAIQYASSKTFDIFETTTTWQDPNGTLISPANWTYGGDQDYVPIMPHGSVYCDPNSPNYMYAGTNYLNRWKGASLGWDRRLGNTALAGSNGTIDVIRIPSGDGQRIYTGSSNGKIYMTTNGGTSWTQIDSGIGCSAVTDISINPNDKDDILVTVYMPNWTYHLYRCSDTTPQFLRIWTDLGQLPESTNGLTRDPDDPQNTLYIGTQSGVYKTVDCGSTWSDYGYALGLPKVDVNELVMVPGTRKLNAATYGRGFWKIAISTYYFDNFDLPSTIHKYEFIPCTVAVTDYAQKGGLNVYLTSSNPSALSVPEKVTIAEGTKSASFNLQAHNLVGNVTITAKIGGSTATDIVQVIN